MSNTARKNPPTATHSLRLIMTDETERRDTPTIEAPPLSSTEPSARISTKPPEADDAAAEAFMSDRLPRDAKLPSNFKQLAERELITLYRTAIGMHESLLGASGLLEQNRRNTVEDIARVVDRGFDRVWERVAPRLDRQDGKIESIKGELADVKQALEGALERVVELELALGLKEKRDAAQGPATPPAEPT